MGDSARIAEAVLRLAQDHVLRARTVRSGLTRAADRFSLGRMVSQTEELRP